MKKGSWIVLGSLALLRLTACGQKKTPAESRWAEAGKAEDLATYVTEHKDELEDLKPEAESAETLGQQFKAVALLCMSEYQESLAAADESLLSGWINKDAFLFDYPETSAYADNYFAKVNTEGEAFWESLGNVRYPYDCLLPMLAATKKMDGETLSRLLDEVPSDSGYKTGLEDAIESWVKNKPGEIVAIGDVLMERGYFDDWNNYDWTGVYLYNSTSPYRIRTATAEEGLAYIRYMRDTLLPGMESKISRDSVIKTSDKTGEEYYSTEMTVTLGEELQLAEPGEGSPLETIETAGKKVAAFYHNPTAEDDVDAPPAWQMMGDFMMGLPEDELPASLSEAEYYLVLTADHQFGNYYQDQSGRPTKIQAVYSSTSVDLYDAGSGAFLCHVGNVMENPSNTIFKDIGEDSAQYPELTPADVLSYIYHNLSNPDSYRTMLDNTSSMEEPLRVGGTGLLGPWEITMNSFEVVKSFDDGVFSYSASDGCQFIRGQFTVSNRGFKSDIFLARDLHLTSDYAILAGVMDESGENYYPTVNAMTYSKCLTGKTVDVEETREGEILFEVPDEALGGSEPMYIAFSLGNQVMLFTTEQ